MDEIQLFRRKGFCPKASLEGSPIQFCRQRAGICAGLSIIYQRGDAKLAINNIRTLSSGSSSLLSRLITLLMVSLNLR